MEVKVAELIINTVICIALVCLGILLGTPSMIVIGSGLILIAVFKPNSRTKK